MTVSGRNHQEAEAARQLLSQAVPLVAESQALAYALVMVLASTPREEFSRQEIDALCQLAYELLNKLARAQEFFQEIDKVSDEGRSASVPSGGRTLS